MSDNFYIHRTDKTAESGNNFTRIDNRVINDVNLTPLARLALVYLLSKPDDWKVSDANLRRYLECGVTKLQSVIKELKTAGYLDRRQLKDNGKWRTAPTHIYESPDLNYRYSFSEHQNVNDGNGLSDGERHGLNGIPTNDLPTNDLPTNEEETTEGGAPAPPTSSTLTQALTAMDVYLKVTGIKAKNKLPEKVKFYLDEINEKGFVADYLQKAILEADLSKEIFEPDTIHRNYALLDPYSFRVDELNINYKHRGSEVLQVNYVINPRSNEKVDPVTLHPEIQARLLERIKKYHAENYQPPEPAPYAGILKGLTPLTALQIEVLQAIRDNGRLSQREIAAKLDMNFATLSGILAKARARLDCQSTEAAVQKAVELEWI